MSVLAIAALLPLAVAASPARAQTHDPAYPVCLQTYGLTSGISCRFTSMPQCRAVASARSAQCIVNPYYGKRRRSG